MDPLPNVCNMIAKGDEDSVEDFLLARNFCELIPDDLVPRSTSGTVILGGIFLIEDRPGKWRLIFDGRRPNSGLRVVRWLKLLKGDSCDVSSCMLARKCGEAASTSIATLTAACSTP